MPAAVARTERTCVQCGETFLVLASKITGDYKALFCSRACAGDSRRGLTPGRVYERMPRQELPCGYCGKTVLRLPSQVRNGQGRFCDIVCANQQKQADRLRLISDRLAVTSLLCRLCGVEKPLAEFAIRRDSNLPRPECKPCRSDQKNWVRTLRLLGVTEADYRRMLEAQGGVCAICGGTPELRNYAVDHDHATGRVRGLLCRRCNLGVGYFLDRPDLLRAAINYLER